MAHFGGPVNESVPHGCLAGRLLAGWLAARQAGRECAPERATDAYWALQHGARTGWLAGRRVYGGWGLDASGNSSTIAAAAVAVAAAFWVVPNWYYLSTSPVPISP